MKYIEEMMYFLASVAPSLALGVLLGLRGGIIAWALASAVVAMVSIALLWRGNFLEVGVGFVAYLPGISAGVLIRR